MNEIKQCVSCKQNKSIKDFYVIKEKHDYYCKYCRNRSSINGQVNNNKRCSLDNCNSPHYSSTFCRMHYERYKRNGETERQLTPMDKVYYYDGQKKFTYRDSRIRHLSKFYNMSMETYDEMAKAGCWVCGRTHNYSRRLHVEHDHKCCPSNKSCGECVRGIVCNKCNILIGKYEKNQMRDDNPNKQKVINYLLNYEMRRQL